MNKPNVVVRVAVLTSAVLLVSAFVAYRAGAFDSLLGNSPQETQMGGSKVKQIFTDADSSQQPTAGSPEAEDALMGGSKSDRILVVPLPKSGAQGPALLGGSKTLSIGPVIVVDSATGKPAPSPSANSQPSKPSK
jgi:hypothetical protein